MSAIDPGNEPPTLVGLLDGLIDQGVHVAGDLAIGLADVELIRVALRLLVASEDTARRTGVGRDGRRPPDVAFDEVGGCRPLTGPPPSTQRAIASDADRGASRRLKRSAPRAGTDGEELARGVAQLVLTVIEVIRELLERQAVRRVEAGSLTDEQVERLGLALQALEERMEEVKEIFGVTDDELNLDLGPLGRLR